MLLDVYALLVGAECVPTLAEFDLSLCGLASPWFGVDGVSLCFGSGAA